MEIKRENLIAIYEQALVSKPNNPLVYSQLAKLYYSQGDFEAALDRYEKALQLQPELTVPDETIKQLYLASKNINDKENSELYKWITLDIESVNKGSDSIDLLYAGDLSGILIKNVFSTSEIETAKKNIESLETEYHKTSYGVNIGSSLTQRKNNLNEYFQKTSDFRVQLGKIFTNLFEQRVFEAFNNLCNLRNIKLLERTNNSIYNPAQIRIVHPNKGGIKAHTDNEVFEKRQIYGHLRDPAGNGYLFQRRSANARKGGRKPTPPNGIPQRSGLGTSARKWLYYTSKVQMVRGLDKTTCAGGFCLCSRDLQSPGMSQI